jgi:hypothetical protein
MSRSFEGAYPKYWPEKCIGNTEPSKQKPFISLIQR